MAKRTQFSVAQLSITPRLLTAIEEALPSVGKQAVNAIVDEVPAYGASWTGTRGRSIEYAVQLALANFLRIVSRADADNPVRPLADSTADAFNLGRIEARSGRSLESILAAYRIGARASWRGISDVLVRQKAGSRVIANLAELVFDYIDELSAATVSGHATEAAVSERVRVRHFEELAKQLLLGAIPAKIRAAAAAARWEIPPDLCVAAVAGGLHPAILPQLELGTLTVGGDTVGLESDSLIIIAPLRARRDRGRLQSVLATTTSIIGPARQWPQTNESLQRIQRALASGMLKEGHCVDADHILPELIVTSDLTALKDLRAQLLEPLKDATASQKTKLTETLHAWVACQGNRDAMASRLFVHPQTVRYRMGQLRELFGENLDSPRFVQHVAVAFSDEPW